MKQKKAISFLRQFGSNFNCEGYIVFFLIVLFCVLFSGKVHADPCAGVPISGDYIVTSSCTFTNTVDGVDFGTGTSNTAVIRVGDTAAATLTIGLNQTIAAGSIIIDKSPAGSSIVITKGGTAKIKLGMPLWMTDVDHDLYPANTTQTALASQPSNSYRRNTMTTIDSVDCQDDSALVYLSHAACYYDLDTDAYTVAGDKTCLNNASCNSATQASVGTGAVTPYSAGQLKNSANGSDCQDTGTNANLVYTSHAACYTDADSDTYTAGQGTITCLNNASCTSATKGSTGAAPVNTYLAGQLRDSANGSDCQDTGTDANLVYQSHAYCWVDDDRDTYTTGQVSTPTCINNASCNGTTKGSDGAAPVNTYLAGQLRDSQNGSDCNDANASWWLTSTTCNCDEDADGVNATVDYITDTCFGATCASKVVNGLACSATGTDCCDTDARAKPGQTLLYTTPRVGQGTAKCPSTFNYDFDCSGANNKNPIYDCTAAIAVTACTTSRPTATTGAVNQTYACGSSVLFKLCTGWTGTLCSGSGPLAYRCPAGSPNTCQTSGGAVAWTVTTNYNPGITMDCK